MDDPSEESAQAIHVRIDAIMEHGDPAMREMLRDLIFEFHNQVMDDPKSRAGMKEKMKKMGEKIVKLPLAFRPEKPTLERKTKPKSAYLISVATVATALFAIYFIPWSKLAGRPSGAPIRVCNIKGNINEGGERIYHVPNGKWYEKTNINESKGERWFCSEDEARGAGWRPTTE